VTDSPERHLDSFRPSTRRWLLGSFAGWGTLFLCLAGVGLVLIAMRWWRNHSASFEVTDQRLIVRRGILFKTVDEIELYRIRDVRLHYSLANQMADIGTLTLTSSDPSTRGAAFELRDIPMAETRREGLRGLVERARRRHGVRPLEVDELDQLPAG
jgi:uncharacterized membrane protein YdbT with pleckstrin-like domain